MATKKEKDKWGRSRKFEPKIIDCGFRHCNKGEDGKKRKFLQKVVQHKFCCDDCRIAENSLLSGGLKKKREKKLKRICSAPGCTKKVPKENRMLCKDCQRDGGNTYFEDEHACYHPWDY